jgi:hypothetical protein
MVIASCSVIVDDMTEGSHVAGQKSCGASPEEASGKERHPILPPSVFRTIQPTAMRGLLSSRATTPEEVHYQRNHRHNQQKVNQRTGNVERKKSQYPHYEQNHEQR